MAAWLLRGRVCVEVARASAYGRAGISPVFVRRSYHSCSSPLPHSPAHIRSRSLPLRVFTVVNVCLVLRFSQLGLSGLGPCACAHWCEVLRLYCLSLGACRCGDVDSLLPVYLPPPPPPPAPPPPSPNLRLPHVSYPFSLICTCFLRCLLYCTVPEEAKHATAGALVPQFAAPPACGSGGSRRLPAGRHPPLPSAGTPACADGDPE